MASTAFVKRLRALAKELAAEVKHAPALGPDDLAPTAKDEGRASKLLELQALYELSIWLSHHGWEVSLAGHHPPRFVNRPLPKESASYFVITKAGRAYQLVHGTQINDQHGRPRAPDISLQKGSATNAPGVGDVIAIWDMKLRGDLGSSPAKRITDGELSRFLILMDWLEVPGVAGSATPLCEFPPAFEVSGLITNGRAPYEPVHVLCFEGISVTEHFANASTPTKPTRVDHRAHVPPGRAAKR
jgi:hypothetical protein